MKKEFKELLSEIEIESNQRIYEPSEKIKVQIPTDYDHILFLGVVYNIFKNKSSFLYQEFESHQDPERIKHIANKLDLTKPGRVSRVDWQINHSINPALFTIEDNKKVLFAFMNGVKEVIVTGDGENGPKPNDILIGLPWDGSLFVPIHHPENARKRSLLNKKFGFGEIDQYNYQYAKYDKEEVITTLDKSKAVIVSPFTVVIFVQPQDFVLTG